MPRLSRRRSLKVNPVSLRDWVHRPGDELVIEELVATELTCSCCGKAMRDWYVTRQRYSADWVHLCCSNATEGQLFCRGDLPWTSKPPEGWRKLKEYMRRFGDVETHTAVKALDLNYIMAMVVSDVRGGPGEPYVHAVSPSRIHKQMEKLMTLQAVQALKDMP